MNLRDYLAKSEHHITHPGARGSTHWHIGPNGEVVYGDLKVQANSKEHAIAVLRTAVRSQLLSNHAEWSFLTAFHKSRNHTQNLKMNADLFHDLHAHGARVLSCRGYYSYHDEEGAQQVTEEPAFLALGLPAKAAIALGAKYSQESILANSGFYNCDDPTRTPIREKRVLDDEIEKNVDQSVIYLPHKNLTFLVDGEWSSPETVPDHLGYYNHLRGDVAKSFGGGEGGYTAPAPPSTSLVLIAAEINLEHDLPS